MKEVVKCILSVCMAVHLAGCGKMDSKDLADKVKLEMQRDLVKQDDYSSLKIAQVTLVHKGGVVYDGIATGDIQGLSVSFDVKCEYDGASLLWNVTPKDHNSLTIMSHKGKQYAEKKFDEKWPEVKKQVKASYDSAVRKSVEVYDKTKESYHAAVEKSAELYGKTMESYRATIEKSGKWYEKAKSDAIEKYNELRENIGIKDAPVSTNAVADSCAAFDKAVQANDYRKCFAIARTYVKEKQGANLAIESCRVAFAAMVKSNPPVAEAHRFLSDLCETASEAYDIVGNKDAARALREVKKSFLDGAPEKDLKAAYQTLMDFSGKEGAFSKALSARCVGPGQK